MIKLITLLNEIKPIKSVYKQVTLKDIHSLFNIIYEQFKNRLKLFGTDKEKIQHYFNYGTLYSDAISFQFHVLDTITEEDKIKIKNISQRFANQFGFIKGIWTPHIYDDCELNVRLGFYLPDTSFGTKLWEIKPIRPERKYPIQYPSDKLIPNIIYPNLNHQKTESYINIFVNLNIHLSKVLGKFDQDNVSRVIEHYTQYIDYNYNQSSYNLYFRILYEWLSSYFINNKNKHILTFDRSQYELYKLLNEQMSNSYIELKSLEAAIKD